jgi:hypothetical protein
VSALYSLSLAKRLISTHQVYAATLFQELATVAGYDPVRGPGSSCLDPRASGKCVLPWGSGTKSVSSVALLASGISFAVRHPLYTVNSPLYITIIHFFR